MSPDFLTALSTFLGHSAIESTGDFEVEERVPESFAREPEIREIKGAGVIRRLCRYCLPSDSRVCQNVLQGVSSMLQNVKVYELAPGYLKRTVELLEGTLT